MKTKNCFFVMPGHYVLSRLSLLEASRIRMYESPLVLFHRTVLPLESKFYKILEISFPLEMKMNVFMHLGHILPWCRWMQFHVRQCSSTYGCEGRHETARTENITEEAKAIKEIKSGLKELAFGFLCPKRLS